MKKRLLIVACCLIIAAFGTIMTGCGDKYADSPYLGTWNASTCEYAGMELNVDDFFGEFSITLEADGSCLVKIEGDEGECKWEPTDKGVKILDYEESLEFASSGDDLSLEYEGVSFTFVKK